ncbi:MAG: ammonia-forming cytochrome c nitrite reductase subunit c552 [Clostridia bacterium]|nr:ammonia-forming cytochrome c nitrite reductase subunit c552 [Clostridia bacterium]
MKRNAIFFVLLFSLLFLVIGCSKTDVAGTESEKEKLSLEIIETISEEWKSSGHQYAVTATAGRGISCGKCHDGVGFAEQLEYADIDFQPDHQTGIDCQACHTGFGKERIDTGTAKLPFMDETFNGGTGAVCASCHNSNSNPDVLFAQSEAGELSRYSYPHYGMNAALLTGQGGMEIPGANYLVSIAHSTIEDSCVFCHMPETEKGYKSHTFKADLKYFDQTCGSCHVDQTIKTFNIGGLQDEIKEQLAKLEQAILDATGAVRIEAASGSFTYYDAEGNQITDIPHEAYVATYNWRLVAKDGSYGVHNPLYAKSLIRESYKYLTGEDL